ncbi:MAG TPA: C1 family peptidase [Pyrinomonadaceae bacterium]|nr:C1 family peptidase [Pyrinomonadaceae bacterium]
MPTRKNTNRVVNIVPSRDTNEDWGLMNAVGAGIVGAPAALPPSVDLRATWWKVGDQKATGSCVGWATADGVLRYHFVKANRLAKTEMLSPRYVWMAAKETDEFIDRPTTFIESDGTSPKAAVDIARRYGVVTDAILPFASGQLYPDEANTFYAIAAQRKIASYFNLFKNFGQWRTWLATTGPLLVALNVDSTWDNATATQGKLDTFKPNTVRGGHAVSVVGYRADGRFIIRNSWGTAWGASGFGFATEAYIQAGFFNEAYGVNL